MVLCSVADVRVHANPVSISSLEITGIIASVTAEVMLKSGATDASIPSIYQAIIHGAAAITLKRARAAGELASSVETPESKIQNTDINNEITKHEEERDSFIQMYMTYLMSFSSYSIPSGRMGFGTVNQEF